MSNSKLIEKLRRSLRKDLRETRLANGDRTKQRELLLRRKAEIVATQQEWVNSHSNLLEEYCRKELPKNYVPQNIRLVICKEQWQNDLWRIIKLTHWSMPPNEYLGRRKRILVFDGDYLLGLIGLASCVWGLKARDSWIGWNVAQKTKKINYVLDAYILGAIPPYNDKYRGSKLLAYIVASNEIRNLWKKEYGLAPAAIVTTTLFGHSAVLNRIRHEDRKLWMQLGYTRGLGTMHFSMQTIKLAKELLDKKKINVLGSMKDAPNWKIRLMRIAIEAAGLRANDFLTHGYKRGIYIMESATNSQNFLLGNSKQMRYHHYDINCLTESWKRYNLK